MKKKQKKAIERLARAFGWDCLSDYAFDSEMAENAVLYSRSGEHARTHADLLQAILRDITE